MGTFAPTCVRALDALCRDVFANSVEPVNLMMGTSLKDGLQGDYIILCTSINLTPAWGSLGAYQRQDNFEIQCQLGSWRGNYDPMARIDRACEMYGLVDDEIIRQVKDGNDVLGITMGRAKHVEINAGELKPGVDPVNGGFDAMIEFVVAVSATRYTT